MSNTITVRRNWKKKIEALCDIDNYTSYSLHSNFVGVDVPTDHDEMVKFVTNELSQMRHTNLRYDKDTGSCTLHVHSNLWFSWNKKIDW